jgi:hypothetical protein
MFIFKCISCHNIKSDRGLTISVEAMIGATQSDAERHRATQSDTEGEREIPRRTTTRQARRQRESSVSLGRSLLVHIRRQAEAGGRHTSSRRVPVSVPTAYAARSGDTGGPCACKKQTYAYTYPTHAHTMHTHTMHTMHTMHTHTESHRRAGGRGR